MDKVNILVVDDRPEGLLAVQAVLDSPLYNLITASSGNEALKHLLSEDFAVILLDVQMPIMNGFETASIIKTREKSRDIPIVFMSAINQDEQYVYQGYGVGAVDYLLKPFDPYILRSKVSIFVDIYRKKKLIQDQANKLRDSEKKLHAQEIDRLEVEGLRRYQTLADSIPHMVFRMNANAEIEYFNKAWTEYTGLQYRGPQEFNWGNIIHKDDLGKVIKTFNNLPPEEIDIECRVVNRSGEFRWHLVRIQPEYLSINSSVTSWLITATDIEDRKRDELAQAFLSHAGEIVVSTLDQTEVARKISEASIPYLGDWVAVDLRTEADEEGEIIIRHRDRRLESMALSQYKIFFHDPENKHGIAALLSLGKSYEKGSFVGGNFITVPLVNKNKVFGTVTFVYSISLRKYSERDFSTIMDLGKRMALAMENSTLYRLSQNAIEARNDFLSIASHELNTPITSLKLQLQMIKKAIDQSRDGQISLERFQKNVDSSVKQVNRLINLVTILLDVTRIQSGKLAYHFTEFKANELLHEVLERHQELLKDSDCKIDLKEDENITVYWDRTRIEQVITNILTNAIKYAPGCINIEMKSLNSHVVISIKDSGKGIPTKQLEKIFDRFERATDHDTVSGLGLGLFIVKQIAEGHSGKVEVESEVDHGTIFRVTLPKRAIILAHPGIESSESHIQ